MIEILKKTKHEIIVKQGNSIYSTTPETAPQQVLDKLQEKQDTPKKTTTTKKADDKKQETTNQTDKKTKTSKKKQPTKQE